MIPGFGLKSSGTPQSQTWNAHYSYKFETACSADLVITDSYCLERTTEGLGYTNVTWCENNKTYLLSARCPGQSISTLRSSITSDQFNLTKGAIPVYFPSKIDGVTFRIDETYDWGTMSFVYTNHGQYPPIASLRVIAGKDVFCADSVCKTAYVMIDNPAKYVIISGDDTQDTIARMTAFIQDNIGKTYSVDFTPLSLMDGAYAFNRAAKVCEYPYGLLRAEKSKIDWANDLFITDTDFTRLYWPFSFYYDPAVWDRTDSIATQMDLMTGEYSFVKKLDKPDTYQLCASDMLQNCAAACSTNDALAIGQCPAPGTYPLASDLPMIVSTLKKLYTPTSFKTPMCFLLFDRLGEQDVTGSASPAGEGAVVMKLEGNPTMYVMAVKGVVNVDELKSILKSKYSLFNPVVTRTSMQGECIQYRYDNGYVFVCDYHGVSLLGFDFCDKAEDCRSLITNAIDTLQH